MLDTIMEKSGLQPGPDSIGPSPGKVTILHEKKKLSTLANTFELPEHKIDNYPFVLNPGLLPSGFTNTHLLWPIPSISQNQHASIIHSSPQAKNSIGNPKNKQNKPVNTSKQSSRSQKTATAKLIPKSPEPAILKDSDFPSLNPDGPIIRKPPGKWLPLSSLNEKPQQPKIVAKPPKKRNLLARLALELIDIPVRVAQELERKPTPASYAYQHNPAIRRTGGYTKRRAVEEGATLVARSCKKKESRLQKIKQEYLLQVLEKLEKLPIDAQSSPAKPVDNAYLNQLAMGYSEEAKRQSEFLNSTKMRANYPVNIAIREFVDNVLLPDELEKPLISLINKLSFRYQLKKRQAPLKAKKRLVSGLKEVIRAANSNLSQSLPKLVVIAVDLQRSPQEKGIDDVAMDMLELLKKRDIPYVFAGTRSELGASLYGQVISSNKVKAACIGILDFQGYESEVKELLETIQIAKGRFDSLAESAKLHE